jgi:predicted nucleotidyltransferase
VIREVYSMTKKDKQIAEELKKSISEFIPLVDFKVFGSRARGDADKYSDMDVFIEVSFINKELKEKISDAAWEVGFKNFTVISPLVFTREEIENSPLRESPIVLNIAQEGVTI